MSLVNLTIVSLPVGMMPVDEVVDARLGSLPLRECWPFRLISAVYRLSIVAAVG